MRKREPPPCTASTARRAAVPFRDFGDERESEPESVRAGGGSAAHEAREDFLALRFADARTAVFDFEDGVVAAPRHADGDRRRRVYFSALPTRLSTTRSRSAASARTKTSRSAETNSVRSVLARRKSTRAATSSPRSMTRRRRCEVAQRQALEIEQRSDHRLQLPRFVLEKRRDALALGVAEIEAVHELREAAHRRQRRLQLVREHALRLGVALAMIDVALFAAAQGGDDDARFEHAERRSPRRRCSVMNGMAIPFASSAMPPATIATMTMRRGDAAPAHEQNRADADRGEHAGGDRRQFA